MIDIPKKLPKNPVLKCQHGEGFCMLKVYPDDVPMSCIYENEKHCPWRVIKNANP